jgi:GT2 family glycosyltransferase
MIPASPSIGIGITTKNRWNDLADTLTHLRDAGLDQLETLVIDDGSDQPMPSDFRARFPWVCFERFDASEGYIPRRNQIARKLSTEFYFSLDDDSHPVAGDLNAAVDWLRSNPQASALVFRVILAGDEIPDVSKAHAPVACNDFIGCSTLFRRELLVSLGGFETRLHFYHEEPEYSFRAFQAGYSCYGYPAVVVRHMVTPVERLHAHRARYFIRNVVLLDLWYYPRPLAYARAIGHLPLLYRALPSLRSHPLALVRGWLEGFYRYFAWGKLKKQLTREQLAIWSKRPSGHGATDSRIPL